MGWIPDIPDARDFTYRHRSVLPLLQKLDRSPNHTTPDQIDLQRDDEGEYFTPPENQGALHSSTAFAVLSLIEYFERRVGGRTFEGSQQFLYRVTRNCLQKPPHRDSSSKADGVCSDAGADLRTTFKVLAHFGVAPEKHCPYQPERFNEEPSRFIYGLAKPPPGLRYFRLDEANCDGASTWRVIESFLVAGFPIVFGFSVPTSLTAAADVPYRPALDGVRGGQAAVIIGYRKHYFGPRQHGLRIRCSWGRHWGDDGNGWLPMAFVHKQLARDFWTCVSDAWFSESEREDGRIAIGELSRPSIVDATRSKSS